MKYYRYMSIAELHKLLDGKKLTNEMAHHNVKGSLSTSVGFCFLRERTKVFDREGNRKKYNPVECFDFLHGVVNPEVMVEFNTNRKDLIASEGLYAAPPGRNSHYSWEQLFRDLANPEDVPLVRAVEYSTTHYNAADMVPLRVHVPDTNPSTRDYSMWGKRWINLKDIPGYGDLPF